MFSRAAQTQLLIDWTISFNKLTCWPHAAQFNHMSLLNETDPSHSLHILTAQFNHMSLVNETDPSHSLHILTCDYMFDPSHSLHILTCDYMFIMNWKRYKSPYDNV